MMDAFVDRIMALEGQTVLEACKNLKLGLDHEMKRQAAGEAIKEEDQIDALKHLPLRGEALDTRRVLLEESGLEDAIELGRLTLLMAVQNEALRPYAVGAIEGAEMGVRSVEPVSLLAVGAAIYMVGRLLPEIDLKRETTDSSGRPVTTRIRIKPLENPLAGLASLVKAIPTLGRG